MKIVILRGGDLSRRHPPTCPGPQAGTRERGVMAIGDGLGHWLLLNMSAAVARQLEADPRLDAHDGLPDAAGGAGTRTVLLTDAQIDHVGGLLGLRDGAPIELYATPAVFEQLTTGLPILPVLQHYCGVHWHVVPVAGDRRASPFRIEAMPGLEFTAIATRAPTPPHLGRNAPGGVGDSIALAVRDLATGQRVFCAPGLAEFSGAEADWMREADCLLVDGPAEAPATDAPRAWLEQLCALPARHKVLFAAGAAAADPEPWRARGLAVAYDGMAIEL